MKKKKSGIEPEEERYLQGLMQGKSQRQAYLDAYPQRRHWSFRTIDNKASELLRRDEIKVRFEQMQQDARDAGAVNTNRVISKLSEVAFAPLDLEKLRPADQLKAMDMLCRLLGLYPAPPEED